MGVTVRQCTLKRMRHGTQEWDLEKGDPESKFPAEREIEGTARLIYNDGLPVIVARRRGDSVVFQVPGGPEHVMPMYKAVTFAKHLWQLAYGERPIRTDVSTNQVQALLQELIFEQDSVSSYNHKIVFYDDPPEELEEYKRKMKEAQGRRDAIRTQIATAYEQMEQRLDTLAEIIKNALAALGPY